MPMSNFSNFLGGVTIRGVPILQLQPGKVFWVNNSSVIPDGGIGGSDSNRGTYLQPFSTIAGALTKCVADRGDIIVLMPGHAESIASATALTINISGVAIVGAGKGLKRPVITIGTATTATLNITAAQVTLHNLLFVANLADIAAALTLTTAKDLTVSNCEFKDTSAILNFATIVDTDATSNNADGLSIVDSNFYGLGATANSALVKMDGTNDRLTINGCYVAHKATTTAGLMPIASGKVVTNAIINLNTIILVGAQAATTGIIITTDGSTNSGMISRNLIQSLDDTTEILVTASSGFKFSQNFYSGVADKSGYLLPAADA